MLRIVHHLASILLFLRVDFSAPHELGAEGLGFPIMAARRGSAPLDPHREEQDLTAAKKPAKRGIPDASPSPQTVVSQQMHEGWWTPQGSSAPPGAPFATGIPCLERGCLTPTGVDFLPLYERAQVVLLTFSRSHPAFGRALINEDIPELVERRDALRIAVLGRGAKVLVFSEHFEPLMEALGYLGYSPDADFGAYQVFTEVSLESAISEVALRVNATLKKREKFYEKQQSRTVVPLDVAAGGPGPSLWTSSHRQAFPSSRRRTTAR